MFSIKKFIIIFFLLIPISNSFGAMVTEVQNLTVGDSDSFTINGIDFNQDGTKVFVLYQQLRDGSNNPRFVDEYNLSTAFDISTAVYAGDSERCELDDGTSNNDKRRIFDLKFTNDGLSFFHTVGNSGSNVLDLQAVHRYDLTSPFDISTCAFANDTTDLNHDDLQNGSNAGDQLGDKRHNRAQGVHINDDGTKLFVAMAGASGTAPDRILEYNFSTPFDLSTISLVLNAGIEIPHATAQNIMNLEFSANGKRLFVTSHNTSTVVQISLNKPYDTSSFNIDGSANLNDLSALNQLRTITFTNNGLKMFIGNDQSDSYPSGDNIFEFDLVCPFNIIEGKCPPVTESSVRTGIAEAQIMIAKSTIDHSTDTVLNRLKWIRRNKDNQNLTNLNIGFDFNNQMLASLTKVIKTSADSKKTKDKEQDIFVWNEGSIAVGRVGDTSISATKKIKVGDYTMGVDQFTNNGGIRGLAFRFGENNVDVGTEGSELETITYNLSFYNTTPIKNDTKFVDTVIGFGKLNLDILTVLDGKRLTANRTGRQVYGTFKIKDEIKKNNFILIPSSQLDIGLTMLEKYSEIGDGAIMVEDQHINTRKLRTSIGLVNNLSNDKYNLKRHGKIEYAVDMNSSSNFKYTYVSDKTKNFDETLSSGAVHNVNGEIGIDIVMPDSLSIFLIYERNQALGSGHTDNIIITIGYLPNKKTNYAFKINGSDNLGSEYKISKNINDFEIDFKLNNQDVLKPNTIDEAMVSLSRIF